MTNYQPKDNTGSLFKNDRREKDTHPHAKGTALINGVEYWVDAWTNQTRDGQPYQSLKFKVKEARQSSPYGQQNPLNDPEPVDDDSDSIPF